MMVIYKSRFLTRAEIWYDEEPDQARAVDWLCYQQRSEPVEGLPATTFYTRVIDLDQSRQQLLAGLNRDTTYKIRRARERDGVICEGCNPGDPVVMDRFEQMFNAFAALKGRTPLNRARMEGLAAAGVLDLSVAKDPQGNTLVYHANYRDCRRATSLELPSLYRKSSDPAERNFISRANRFLMWSNILRYQEQGLKGFDFGGWYLGSTDQARLDINRFKEGFGGRIVREYNSEAILSLKGRLVLAIAALLHRAGLFAARNGTEPRRRTLQPTGTSEELIPPRSLPAAETAAAVASKPAD